MSFSVTRSDGRSNADVICDLIVDREPDETITYVTIMEALEEGSETEYTRDRVQDIVRRTLPRLLQEQKRTLANIPNVGYRVAPAEMHVILAGKRRDKADNQLALGLKTLEHVRWDEMDENQRLAHQGQLLILSAFCQQMSALERRQASVEQAIAQMRTNAKP